MYCFGENHRYSLFEDLRETLGATFGEILGATLDANFGRKKSFKKKFFLGLMRLFCLSIYIRNITYWTTVLQRIKKNEKSPFCSSKRSACCLSEGIQLSLLTLIQVSAILSDNQCGNQTGKPDWSVQS